MIVLTTLRPEKGNDMVANPKNRAKVYKEWVLSVFDAYDGYGVWCEGRGVSSEFWLDVERFGRNKTYRRDLPEKPHVVRSDTRAYVLEKFEKGLYDDRINEMLHVYHHEKSKHGKNGWMVNGKSYKVEADALEAIKALGVEIPEKIYRKA